MGCDIHAYAEVLLKGRWHQAGEVGYDWNYDTVTHEETRILAIKDVYDERNYTLFGILAGVRVDDEEPIIERRGLPSDVSKELKKRSDNMGADGHSHHYYYVDELVENKLRFVGREYVKSFVPEVIDYLVGLGKFPGVEDVRFVFWFDN